MARVGEVTFEEEVENCSLLDLGERGEEEVGVETLEGEFIPGFELRLLLALSSSELLLLSAEGEGTCNASLPAVEEGFVGVLSPSMLKPPLLDSSLVLFTEDRRSSPDDSRLCAGDACSFAIV